MEDSFHTSIPSYNDGWLLLDNLEDYEFLNDTRFTIATTYHDGNKLYAYRNTKRPLYYHSNSNRVVVASTKDILKRTGLNKNILTKPYRKYEW